MHTYIIYIYIWVRKVFVSLVLHFLVEPLEIHKHKQNSLQICKHPLFSLIWKWCLPWSALRNLMLFLVIDQSSLTESI
jgi:hypothetical protein